MERRLNIGVNQPPQRIIISWLNPDDPEDETDDGKTIKHDPDPEPSSKD